MKIKTFLIILTLALISCKRENIDGIIIGDSLYTQQSLSENREMQQLIMMALKSDKDAIVKLANFPNGGAAGSYDLGYVMTQIIYRIGENDFCLLLKEIPASEYNQIEGLIAVGLEYGDNNYDGLSDDKRIESEFPAVAKILNE